MDNLKFTAPVGGQHEFSSELKYRAPKSGYYKVKASLFRYEPTGEFETILNPRHTWFRFWEPKTIVKEKWRLVELKDAAEKIVYLNEGDEVPGGGYRL